MACNDITLTFKVRDNIYEVKVLSLRFKVRDNVALRFKVCEDIALRFETCDIIALRFKFRCRDSKFVIP